MNITKKAILIKKRHKERLALVKWLMEHKEERNRNKYKQDALLMAGVRNLRFVRGIYS